MVPAMDAHLMDLSKLTHGELFTLHSNVMGELRKRALVRTANNAVADLGELLFCSALGWRREHQQGKDIDAITPNNERVQIKARRMTRDKEASRSGIIRDKEGWDLVGFAMFNPDFSIKLAVIIPRHVALQHLKWSNRQQGWYISLTRKFWDEVGLIDVTETLRATAETLFSRQYEGA